MKNKKSLFKMTVDVFMTAVLFFLMGYQFWGENLHEIAGVIIFIFFIFHHVLNRNWYRNLFKGKYILVRIFQICINIICWLQ